MIPNMAVLPLVELLAKAQIEKVQSRSREVKRDDNTWHSGSLNLPDWPPGANSSQLSGGMALGQIPGSWLSVRGRPFCMAWSSQSDTSLTRPAISSLAVPAARFGIRIALNPGGNSMEAIGLLVTLEARPGKEADAEAFLKSAQPLALNESGTLKWYAMKLGPGKFGIFDTFANEGGRNAHLSGEIAKALGARANELFATTPRIDKVEILTTTPLKN